ncbi:probable CCR4-associated factor 1 homolog 11 [Quercus robur]|uniref:probable CCR4-associated factor 1 homolog 11 n=1 Tax=Quercus robur TaxID=38942 RepID=UPI0021630883|nr:probable CCR4-associated factor 1 homolog 11 [Quercus robur]
MDHAVIVRKVWKENLVEEFDLIKVALMSYHMVSIDTEFPGIVYRPANVDKHELGKLPPIWNYQNPESIELLERQGIEFDKNLKEGIIDYADFAALMLESGLLGDHSAFTWVTFHGAYDIAHLMKILIRQPLPYDLMGFMNLVQRIFGKRLFDLKHMMKFCDGLYGGLEKVANTLGVQRLAGKSHQAGSDTLLTLQTFRKFLDVHFKENNNGGLRHNGHLLTRMQCVLHGLELNNCFHQFNNAGLKIITRGFHGLNLNLYRQYAICN